MADPAEVADVVVKQMTKLGTAVLTCLGLLWDESLVGATSDEASVRAARASIVPPLAGPIGPRSDEDPANLNAAAEFISQRLASFDYKVTAQPYQAGDLAVHSIVAERRGTEQPHRVIVIGAYDDTVAGSSGADVAIAVAALETTSAQGQWIEAGRLVCRRSRWDILLC